MVEQEAISQFHLELRLMNLKPSHDVFSQLSVSELRVISYPGISVYFTQIEKSLAVLSHLIILEETIRNQ